ncbi:MAG: hypothetical protein K1X92_12600 [Bacteroidia bacterium]|nr:hypothetical protein [Bacteroidia bacterium]
MNYFFRILLFSLFFLITGSRIAMAQGVVMNDFKVAIQGGGIQLDWELQNETGVSEFRIYRKAGSQTDFEYVSTQYANGTLRYSYFDKEVFKNDNLIITYQLRVIKNGVPSLFHATLSQNTTSVQRTWGSIKGMFR